MRPLLRGLLDLALPPVCADCATAIAPGRALCPTCDRALPRFSGAAPPLLPSRIACATAVAYEGTATDWLRRFKYPRRGLSSLDPAAQSVLTSWILEAAAKAPGERPGLVIPVALHPRRLRTRGFNPAALLARTLARELGLRHDLTALVRVRDTVSQTGLDRRTRRRNVAGAFCPRRPLAGRPHIWLVDDVVTTGSTTAAAASALARCDIESVTVICAARTPVDPVAVGVRAKHD